MLFPCFHPGGWYHPGPITQVDLPRRRPQYLASPGRGQNRKFQSAGGYALALAYKLQEGRQIGIGQCRVVLRLLHIEPRRQQVFEMAALAGWVLSVAVSSRFGPIKNVFDAATDPCLE